MKLDDSELYQIAMRAFREKRFEEAARVFAVLAFSLLLEDSSEKSSLKAMKMTIESYKMLADSDDLRQILHSTQGDVPKQYFTVVRHYLDHLEETNEWVVQKEINRDFPLGISEVRDMIFQEGVGSTLEKSVGGYHVCIVTAQGPREGMEDAHLATEIEVNVEEKKHRFCLFGVFDGHGGAGCADYVQKYLPTAVQQQIEAKGSITDLNLYNAITRAFVLLNDQWLHLSMQQTGQKDVSGTTATVAIIDQESIWVANVGDSRAVLGLNGKAIQLTEDAKPTMEKYIDEILFRGGSISWGRVDGTLDMARSIGDLNHPSVSARPVLKKIDRNRIPADGCNCLFIACDGLWDVIDPQQVVELAEGKTVKETAIILRTLAFERGSWDNLTVMAIDLS
ncbi:MAG: PP2C family protein-serine/threonine phosphatase [Waddliaceae bacterium]